MGKNGSKWKHGFIPLNAAAVRLHDPAKAAKVGRAKAGVKRASTKKGGVKLVQGNDGVFRSATKKPRKSTFELGPKSKVSSEYGVKRRKRGK